MPATARFSAMPTAPRLNPHTTIRENASEALHDRAADNLRFIRDTMARAGAFTSVSGAGMAAAGAVGFAATAFSLGVARETHPGRWVGVWLAAAVVAGGVSWWAISRKAARTGQSLSAGPARRFTLAFAPAIVAGALLTVAMASRGLTALLPGIWLTLYGAAVTAGGAYSVRPVPIMGFAFLALGAIGLTTGPTWHPILLAAGFGGLHLLFGYLIARHHGG